jgi:hypothetical protein
MDDLSVSMRYAGTVGAGFGFTLEETSAAIVQLADLGLKGSKSGTVFRLAMTKAANVTGVAQKVLEKYGLTQDDINPKMQKFAGILKTVAESQMEVEDAMVVFGMEAGANIVQIARNNQAFDEGTRAGLSYAKALEGIGKAQRENLAETTAEQVSQTVVRQFRRLTSAVANLADDIYKTYSAQLLELIKEAILLTNEIGRQFSIAASTIEGSFGGALQSITDYLRVNRAEIASFAVTLIQSFSALSAQLFTLGPVLFNVAQAASQVLAVFNTIANVIVALIPGLDSTAQLMASIFLVSRIVSFVSMLNVATTSVGGLSGAVKLLAAELAISTGGAYALVAAVGALVVGIGYYISVNNDAAKATERLTQARERQQQRAVNDAAQTKFLSEQTLKYTQDIARQQLNSNKKLSAARKQEIQELLKLDAAQAESEFRAGRLSVVNGQLRTAYGIVADAQERGVSASEALSDADTQRQVVIKQLTAEIGRYEAAIAKSKKQTQDPFLGKYFINTALGLEGTAKAVGSVEDAQARLADLRAQLDSVTTASQNWSNQAAIAKSNIESTPKDLGGLPGSVSQAAAEFDRMAAAAQNASESASELYNRIVADFEKATQDQRTARAKALEDQIAQDQAAYDQIIAIKKAAGQDTAALEFERIAAEGLRRSAAYAEALADAKKYAEQVAAQTDETLRTEQEKRSAARRKELQDLRDHYAALLAVDVGGKDRKAEIRQQAQDAEQALKQRYAAEDAQRYRAAMDEINGILAEASADAQEIAKQQVQATMTEYERSIAEGVARVNELRAAAIAQIRAMEKEGKLSPGQVQLQLDAFEANFAFTADAIMRKAHESGLGKWAQTFIGSQLTRVLSEEGEAKVDQFVAKFKNGMQKVKSAISGVRSVIGTLGKAFSAVMSVVTTVSGFSLNFLSMIQNIVADIFHTQQRAADEAARRAQEAGFDPEAARRRAMEANDPATLARGFVNDLAQRAIDFANIFAQAIGPMLSVLIERMPEIIMAVVDAIPEIVNALADNIGPLITALADGAVELVIALIQQLPVLVPALVNAIVFYLLPKIPTILAKVIAELALQLPKMLWNVFTSLLDGLIEWIKNSFKLFFGSREEKERIAAMRQEKRDFRSSFYSGIDYVPATMRATLHQGEAVIPADRNMQRAKTAAPAPAGYAQNFGGGPAAAPSKVEVAVIAEGRLLEAVQLTAQSMGRANGMNKKIRRAAGVQVGFFRGQFNPFSV